MSFKQELMELHMKSPYAANGRIAHEVEVQVDGRSISLPEGTFVKFLPAAGSGKKRNWNDAIVFYEPERPSIPASGPAIRVRPAGKSGYSLEHRPVKTNAIKRGTARHGWRGNFNVNAEPTLRPRD